MERLTQGYCIVTETITGPQLLWRVTTQDGDSPAADYPDIYATEKEAQKEIVGDRMEYLQQFLDDEREFDEIPGDNDFICTIDISPEGDMKVIDHSTGWKIIKTTLEKWRKSIS